MSRKRMDIPEDIILEAVADDESETNLMVTDSDELPAVPVKKGIQWHKFRLPRFEDEGQKRAFRKILRFLAVVIIITIVARGTAGATMARVDLAVPTAGEIIESIQATGTVEAVRFFAPELPSGITIAEVLVIPGQAVKAGDALLVLDSTELAEQRSRQDILLGNMELSLAKLERGEAYDGSALVSAQTAYDWAVQDVESTKTAGQAAVDAATQALNTARQELAAAQVAYDTLIGNEGSTVEEISAAKQVLENAGGAVFAAESGLAAAQGSAEQNNLAAARASETARQGLAAAQQADTQARQGVADARAQNELDAQTLRLDIENQKTLLTMFDNIEAEGVIYSEISGTVLETGLPGDKTENGAAIRISDSGGGFHTQAIISAAQAKSLSSGASATVAPQGGYFDNQSLGNATLLSLSEPDAGNNVTAIFRLPDGAWSQGQNVSLEIIHSRERYEACVPLSAIHQSANGYYVLVVEAANGVMGTENVVHVVSVQLLANDGVTAAIEGAIAPGAKIVATATKSLAEGDKVRVNQP